jgi:hypothetical protein
MAQVLDFETDISRSFWGKTLTDAVPVLRRAIGLKKMVLGCPMDCSHHGLKLSDTANANAGVGRGVGFPQ